MLAGNHNSNLDALAIMSLMPLRLLPKLRPVAAMDYFYTSRLRGWFANNIVGIIPVKRGSGKEGGNPLQLAEEALERGEILVIFPEGTRGEPETLQAFKKGIGHLAHARPKVPVVPIFMHGLGKALPRGSMLLVPFNVTVNVGEPVYGTDSYAEFVSKLEAGDDRARGGGEAAGVGVGPPPRPQPTSTSSQKPKRSATWRIDGSGAS